GTVSSARIICSSVTRFSSVSAIKTRSRSSRSKPSDMLNLLHQGRAVPGVEQELAAATPAHVFADQGNLIGAELPARRLHVHLAEVVRPRFVRQDGRPAKDFRLQP